jgi:hypothetical protein
MLRYGTSIGWLHQVRRGHYQYFGVIFSGAS